jgi:integrase
VPESSSNPLQILAILTSKALDLAGQISIARAPSGLSESGGTMREKSSNRIKLTKASVERVPFVSRGQRFLWDTELPGFGLCVGSKSRTYLVQRTMGGRGPNRETVKVRIGRHGIFTAEEARREARDLLNRMARGENPRETKRKTEAESLTLRQAWVQFQSLKPNLSPKTIESYSRVVNRDLACWLDRPLAGISGSELVREYLRQSSERTPSTAARNMRCFRAIYNFAMAIHENLPQNPADRLKKLRLWHRDPPRSSYIRPHQLPVWYAGIMRLQNDHAPDYFRLLVFTGMRKSEGLALRWEHIDFGGRTLTVPKTKNGDPLVLPLSSFLVDLFKARRQRFPSAEWVFPGDDPERRIEEPKKWIKRANEASGIKFSPHDLRRTFITVAESLDLSAYTLKRLMNHRTGWDVTAGYIILDVERLRAPMQRITDRLMALCQAELLESRHHPVTDGQKEAANER